MTMRYLILIFMGLLVAFGVMQFGCGVSADSAKWVESDWIATRSSDGKRYHIEITLGSDRNVKWRFGKMAGPNE